MTADIDAVLSRLSERPEIAADVRLVAREVERLTVEIHGCWCPAPYDTCPHDEPLAHAVSRLADENAQLRAEVERLRQIEAAAEAYHAEWDRWKRIAVDLADEEHRLLRSLAVAAVDCRLADEIAEWVDGLELHGDAELMAALAALGESTPEVPSDG